MLLKTLNTIRQTNKKNFKFINSVTTGGRTFTVSLIDQSLTFSRFLSETIEGEIKIENIRGVATLGIRDIVILTANNKQLLKTAFSASKFKITGYKG
ncbi:MAG: hypothetical protein FWD32_02300 [Firmicutes bacterium]|nr:hypothetical protein [Bacillota bacterium]